MNFYIKQYKKCLFGLCIGLVQACLLQDPTAALNAPKHTVRDAKEEGMKLINAVEKNDTPTVKELLQAGVDPNSVEGGCIWTYRGLIKCLQSITDERSKMDKDKIKKLQSIIEKLQSIIEKKEKSEYTHINTQIQQEVKDIIGVDISIFGKTVCSIAIEDIAKTFDKVSQDLRSKLDEKFITDMSDTLHTSQLDGRMLGSHFFSHLGRVSIIDTLKTKVLPHISDTEKAEKLKKMIQILDLLYQHGGKTRLSIQYNIA